MAMNREQKRLMQRQGMAGPDGEPVRTKERPRATPRPQSERTSPAQYVREVRSELRKVAWPDRPEVVRLSGVVFACLVVMTLLIFVIDYLSAKGVFYLFKT